MSYGLSKVRACLRMMFLTLLATVAMTAAAESAFAHKGFIEICKVTDGKPMDGKDADTAFKFSIWEKGVLVRDHIWVKPGTCTGPIPVSTDNGEWVKDRYVATFTIKEVLKDTGYSLTGIEVLPNMRLQSINLANGSVTVKVPSADTFGGQTYADRTDETLVIFHNRKKYDGVIKLCKFFEDDKKYFTPPANFTFDVQQGGHKKSVKVPVDKCVLLPHGFPKGEYVTITEREVEGIQVKDIKAFSSDPSINTDLTNRSVSLSISDSITVIIFKNKKKEPPKPPCKGNCTYTIGGYRNTPSRIVEAITSAGGSITIAGVTFTTSAADVQALVNILATNPAGGCQERQLARQLVAATLNLARGACPTNGQAAAIEEADALLAGLGFSKTGVPDDACGDLGGDIGGLISDVTSLNESKPCR